MHAKHRNGPGNGFRGNVMGIACSSRSPSEGQIRAHRMHNSEYRNYNHGRGGYGRGGHSKHFQHQIQTIREAEILIEAGRLAAEYLVSKELLSPAALSGRYSDAFGNYEIRSQKGDFSDGRVSVHSRLGSASPDIGHSRRRYSDDYTSLGSRSSMKGRKRADSLKGNASEVNRDLRRTASLTKNSKASLVTNSFDEHTCVEDGNNGVPSSLLGETNEEVDNEIQFNSGFIQLKKADPKDSSLSNEPSDAEGKLLKELHDAEKIDDNNGASEGPDDYDLNQNCDEKEVKDFSREIDLASNAHFDLLKHCKFVSFPKKPRSSLTIKASRSNQHCTNEDKNVSEKEPLESSSVHVMDTDTGSSVCNDSSYRKHDSVCFHLNDTQENNLGLDHTKKPGECSRSGSKEAEKDDSLSSFGASNSTFSESGKKRTVDSDADGIDELKKFRQWIMPLDMQSECISKISTTADYQPMVQESGYSHMAISTLSGNENVGDGFQFMEEKHLLPGSFKTCDLNLNENNETDSGLALASSKKIGNASMPIDIDLSISNTNDEQGVTENGIEVIDLEKCDLEVETFENPDGRGETLFTGYTNNLDNGNGISDVHDGFGLMISEFLGNNSPSVPTDMNSLHNQMFLPNNEGMLGDDDSIYMSLGEIPIGFMRSWEQPTQEFGKPF